MCVCVCVCLLLLIAGRRERDDKRWIADVSARGASWRAAECLHAAVASCAR